MSTAPTQELSRLFGMYKAEWLNGQLFELFTEPTYFPDLRSQRPCVLIGGRGTGKTTVLRGLSYEGQFALAGRDATAIRSWEHIALYYRVNPNRVTAFKGPELSENDWTKCFAHYMNLLLCGRLVDFLTWYSLHTGVEPRFAASDLNDLCASLHLAPATSISSVGSHIRSAVIGFEACINNIGDGSLPPLSIQGAPIDALTGAIAATPELSGRTFAFLLDEYENFLDYQQRVVNTLIKHSEGPYTFKIGVRELGWRVRETLNTNERLVHPADYQRIDIGEHFSESTFRDFADKVCNSRLNKAIAPSGTARSIRDFFPRHSDEEEARRLGVEDSLRDVYWEMSQSSDQSLQAAAKNMEPLKLYFLKLWANGQNLSLMEVLQDHQQNVGTWQTRYENYKHSCLFAIRKGKRGIRKHYAGWDVFCLLAAGNIRYLLELVHQSFLVHFDERGDAADAVTPEHQTIAAERVGKKNLTELEGVSVEGARLTKLLLSLGRLFQVMAADPVGHTPEVNQFCIASETPEQLIRVTPELESLLRAAIMHLALVRQTGNKLADEADTRDYDYMVHPIFAPFFVFSHRRKRKMKLTPDELLGLVRAPADTIRTILAKTGRSEQPALPDQLLLFQGFFRGTS
ncbi:MAG: hypothetical protein KF869_08020 [Phycisphaeraceae bacterium]|nr:hypothetical protein [Phycisphaeraceae bacterium]